MPTRDPSLDALSPVYDASHACVSIEPERVCRCVDQSPTLRAYRSLAEFIGHLGLFFLALAGLVWLIVLTGSAGVCAGGRTAEKDLATLATSVEMYALIHDARCPGDPEQLVEAGMLKKAPRDPWGAPYHIHCSPRGAAVLSSGPDGRFATEDDLVEHVEWLEGR